MSVRFNYIHPLLDGALILQFLLPLGLGDNRLHFPVLQTRFHGDGSYKG